MYVIYGYSKNVCYMLRGLNSNTSLFIMFPYSVKGDILYNSDGFSTFPALLFVIISPPHHYF